MTEPTAKQQFVKQLLDAARPHGAAEWECQDENEAFNLRKRIYRYRDTKYRQKNFEDVNLQVGLDKTKVILRWVHVPGQLRDKDGNVIWEPPKQKEQSDVLAATLAAVAEPMEEEDD